MRAGSPAGEATKAKTLYINQTWLNEHARDIFNQHPIGTGEKDYAFLLLSHRNASFLTYNTKIPPTSGENVIMAGYPSPFTSLTLQNKLDFVSVLTQIANTDSFSYNSPDLLYFGGSLVAEHGSSGGPIVDNNASLIGIIVTATPADTVETRQATAISLTYIDKDLAATTGMGLEAYLSGNLEQKQQSFLASQGRSFEEFFAENLTLGN